MYLPYHLKIFLPPPFSNVIIWQLPGLNKIIMQDYKQLCRVRDFLAQLIFYVLTLEAEANSQLSPNRRKI